MSVDERPGSGYSEAISHHSHHTSSTSEYTAPPKGGAGPTISQSEGDPYGRFKLMFTGPDGTRNHNVKRMNGEYTGTGDRSFERTGNLGYMFRMPKEFPFPKAKHGRLGEIGSEVELWDVKKGL